MRMFARYGVREYWIVDPILEQIEIHTLEDDAYRRAQVASGGDIVRVRSPAGSDVRGRARLRPLTAMFSLLARARARYHSR